MALAGTRVIELAGLAPSPFAGMVLADFGAKVIRVDRLGQGLFTVDRLSRGKRSISMDLKRTEGVQVFKRMCKTADVLIEPYRPGVMEKLGLGPQVLMADNPRLIYARMTGFGQSGPFKQMAGHDINYIGLSGVLSFFGRKGEKPTPPVNTMADFAGGGMICALGITMALLERARSGKGQVIDANMVEGSAYVSSFLWTTRDLGLTGKERGTGLLDTGAPYYDTYKTSDGLGLSETDLPPQVDRHSWPSSKEVITRIFASKTQADWCRIFDGTDACVTPVLTGDDAPEHPHNKARGGSFLQSEDGEGMEPGPAPRLSRTPAVVRTTEQTAVGQGTKTVLLEVGLSEDEIQSLVDRGIVGQEAQQSKL
ncbi:alpha-methylacyl-CoA racemase-like isoform X2 [Acanthaster planci]|uniref:Alpha-methylacyl-CoA racemase-like isoform X2 n=1 Tax=Acanthaster planci TaxID=133434 RepID=A0A8B7ZIF3_ACAPL|nr:alpha-methylacyl-CoA racemase-like isoform X2 [Acanthaster planci]